MNHFETMIRSVTGPLCSVVQYSPECFAVRGPMDCVINARVALTSIANIHHAEEGNESGTLYDFYLLMEN